MQNSIVILHIHKQQLRDLSFNGDSIQEIGCVGANFHPTVGSLSHICSLS